MKQNLPSSHVYYSVATGVVKDGRDEVLLAPSDNTLLWSVITIEFMRRGRDPRQQLQVLKESYLSAETPL